MGTGFEIIKRPGLNRFLQEMGKVYEVVIFGTEDASVNLLYNIILILVCRWNLWKTWPIRNEYKI